ncbi:MAG: hypothetical protein K2N51_19300 [Lachnospiraceae bacterium]|nr:hypothetical protein [Lachnospiraceae bacterium]
MFYLNEKTKKYIQKGIDIIKKWPIASSIGISLGIGFAMGILAFSFDLDYLLEPIFSALIIGGLVIYPCILTLINLASLFKQPKDTLWKRKIKQFEFITIILGLLYSMMCLAVVNDLFDIMLNSEWSEQLYNSELHQPVWTNGVPVSIMLCVIGGLGYLILSCIKLEKMPPLIIVLAIAAMYLGMFECIVWCIQIFSLVSLEYSILCLFPFNCIIIGIKTIRYKITEWNAMEEHNDNAYKTNSILGYFHKNLMHAAYWPIIAFILMWPLLGIVLCFLMLFGQKPDYLIKAWTETADWRLSQKTAPPNLHMDEHYLCTVAAGGHNRIVKPIRMGERHGHRVVVNRQLCIANAFEQILEERTPRFHKCVRHIYDTYGFPIAKLIRTKTAADIVYLLMKPLEWFFLIVLYLCDTKPENRIAMQYLPKRCKVIK